MRNVSDESCIENQNINFIVSNFPEIHAVYEIMWKNTVQPERPQLEIQRMRLA
jgi:hypothetical protein